jgi:hypothetical protein
MARNPHTQLATRRIGVDRIGAGAAPGAGAVDEYLALQGAAIGRLVGCGVEASAAALRMRAEAHRIVRDSGLAQSLKRRRLRFGEEMRRRRRARGAGSSATSPTGRARCAAMPVTR